MEKQIDFNMVSQMRELYLKNYRQGRRLDIFLMCLLVPVTGMTAALTVHYIVLHRVGWCIVEAGLTALNCWNAATSVKRMVEREKRFQHQEKMWNACGWDKDDVVIPSEKEL
jgi:hypothetical protein